MERPECRAELLSTRAFRRMRRVLTHYNNGEGKWERFRIADPPKTRKEGGTDPLLSRAKNRDHKIYTNSLYLAEPPALRHR